MTVGMIVEFVLGVMIGFVFGVLYGSLIAVMVMTACCEEGEDG